MKNVTSLIKTRLYFIGDCIKIRKHAETFHVNKGCKLAVVVFIPFRCFQNTNLGCSFQTLFARKRGLAHPCFLCENESLRHCLSYYLRRMAMFLVVEVRFSQGFRFLEGQFFLRTRFRVWVRFLERCPSFCLFYVCSTRHIKFQNQNS